MLQPANQLAGIRIDFSAPGVEPRDMITHPSTNRARRRITSLIETNALPLSQTVKPLTKMRYS